MKARSRSKLLLTAFEPFGGERVNPAWEAVSAIEGEEIVKLLLPVEYGTAAEKVIKVIDELCPAAVVCVGQAGGRDAVTPEKYAVNLRNALSADNAGRVCREEKIVPGGEERLESSFGAEEIARAISESGIPSRVSESAGTFVCNDVMYGVLRRLRDTGVPAGFIHVPYCEEQKAGHPDSFALPASQIARALTVALEVIKQKMYSAE